MLEVLEGKADLVVLARYMQVLSPGFVARFPGRIINIHHSFLPGLRRRRPVPAGLRARREDRGGHRPLRHRRARRRPHHRPGRGPGEPPRLGGGPAARWGATWSGASSSAPCAGTARTASSSTATRPSSSPDDRGGLDGARTPGGCDGGPGPRPPGRRSSPRSRRPTASGRFARDAWRAAGRRRRRHPRPRRGRPAREGGVNVSRVHGAVPPRMAARLPGDGDTFAAVGLSLVIHPRSPWVPTTHANVRLLARGSKAWFGGGADLTPYYLFEEDAAHFHRELRGRLRAPPAGQLRGVQADLRRLLLPPAPRRAPRAWAGSSSRTWAATRGGSSPSWRTWGAPSSAPTFPSWSAGAGLAWGERERDWQEIRRGRYVEFNLLHDRGTVFGLETGGRTESILMSLPPRVQWRYDHHPEPGSEEERLLQVIRAPRDWA